jgi:hypothetical protein
MQKKQTDSSAGQCRTPAKGSLYSQFSYYAWGEKDAKKENANDSHVLFS